MRKDRLHRSMKSSLHADLEELAALQSQQQADPQLWYHEHKGAVMAFTLLVNVVMSGIVFGFAALKAVLMDSGVFDSKCDRDHAGCVAQLMLIDLMYTLASGAINFFGIPMGMFIDAKGPRIATTTGLLRSLHFCSCGVFTCFERAPHFGSREPQVVPFARWEDCCWR